MKRKNKQFASIETHDCPYVCPLIAKTGSDISECWSDYAGAVNFAIVAFFVKC